MALRTRLRRSVLTSRMALRTRCATLGTDVAYGATTGHTRLVPGVCAAAVRGEGHQEGGRGRGRGRGREREREGGTF
eukprot:3183331-Rhodomonas_salina.1